MKLSILVGAAALTFLAAPPAGAAVTIIGDSLAAQCSDAAIAQRSDPDSLRLCSAAIEDSFLDRHDLSATYVNRGIILMMRGELDDAKADFDRALALAPKLGEAWVNRGAAAIFEKRFQDGIDDTSKGLALGTEEPAKAYFNRAVAYEGLNDETSAYNDYQQALTLAPKWDMPKEELLRFTVTRR